MIKKTIQKNAAADLVFKNGSIYTVDPKRPRARAVAVKGAEIIHVGDDRGADDVIGPGTEVIDLQGKMMLPGFHDVHVHLYEGGMQRLQHHQEDCHTLDEAVSGIKQYVKSQGRDADGWIQCSGLQKTCADELTRDVLD
ncbi:MAG: amidohydrolase family protein, partial [Desulfobacterales bacterium]|nr:amidohydrolase family protein [Desulfobacterales bacterium]